MKLDAQTLEYLQGKKFSNNLQVPYNFLAPIPSRVTLLGDLAKGKRILHLGCLDHLPLIDGKISNNKWLHKILTENASVCLGIDINTETKEYVEKKYGFKNIIIGDFTKEKLPQVSSQQWDYAILGEILEHIDNPVAYLQSIRDLYKDCLKKIVITVPNAWTQRTMQMASQSIEIINSDHRYWFTPYTLTKVMMQAGLVVEEVHFANRVPLTIPGLVRKKILHTFGKEPKYNFTYASSIVAVARMAE